MAIRFRKTKKSGPLRLTVGKKSLGSSLGGKVAGVSFNTKNGPRFRVTVPGTGITFTQKIGGKARDSSADDSTQFAHQEEFETYKPPIPRRGWFTAIAVILILGGLVSFSNSLLRCLICLIIGIVMFAIRARTPLTATIENEHYEINQEDDSDSDLQ